MLTRSSGFQLSLALYCIFLLTEFKAQDVQNDKLAVTFQDNLMSLKMNTPSNDTINFYLDTGGKNFLYKTGRKKLGLKSKKGNLWRLSKIESLFDQQGIPQPFIKSLYYVREKDNSTDGMLGREWFAMKTWEFDYSSNSLSCYPKEAPKQTVYKIPIHFKKDSLGNHTDHLPRIELVVDSDTLSFLFDTGAQVILSENAQDALNKNPIIATSFIDATTFDKWKANHPDWTIIENADLSFNLKEDLIIVPEVIIGNQKIGPVEFVRREDFNFQTMSKLFMDEAIQGAIGGNALSQLGKFIINYKKEFILIN